MLCQLSWLMMSQKVEYKAKPASASIPPCSDALPRAAETQAVGNGKIMRKVKRKLSSAEKVEKKRRQKEYMTIFINGKQKRVKRPPAIDGIDVEEFICRNADPIWLHQNEMWEYITIQEEPCHSQYSTLQDPGAHCSFSDEEDPFALPAGDGKR
jgi:hypothetical protein